MQRNYQVVKVTLDIATKRTFELVHAPRLQEKSARHMADQLNEQANEKSLAESSEPDAVTIVSYIAKPIVRE